MTHDKHLAVLKQLKDCAFRASEHFKTDQDCRDEHKALQYAISHLQKKPLVELDEEKLLEIMKITPYGELRKAICQTFGKPKKDTFQQWIDSCPDKVLTIEEIREITKRIPSLHKSNKKQRVVIDPKDC